MKKLRKVTPELQMSMMASVMMLLMQKDKGEWDLILRDMNDAIDASDRLRADPRYQKDTIPLSEITAMSNRLLEALRPVVGDRLVDELKD